MITPIQEYYNNLWRIQSPNPPHLAILIPSSEKIYDINLNTRIIEAPEYLSVEQDHKSEMIYFKVDRYYETMDLADTVCIVQYVNKTTKRSGCYAVPFYDTITCSKEDSPKILFPWCIDGLATEKAGTVEYSIKFYAIGDNNAIVYNLNTLPAQSKVLYGINANMNEVYEPIANAYEDIINRIVAIEERDDLYWDIIE